MWEFFTNRFQFLRDPPPCGSAPGFSPPLSRQHCPAPPPKLSPFLDTHQPHYTPSVPTPGMAPRLLRSGSTVLVKGTCKSRTATTGRPDECVCSRLRRTNCEPGPSESWGGPRSAEPRCNSKVTCHGLLTGSSVYPAALIKEFWFPLAMCLQYCLWLFKNVLLQRPIISNISYNEKSVVFSFSLLLAFFWWDFRLMVVH